MAKTKVIAIEGIDGSGKSVQFQMLREYLVAQNLSLKTLEFPAYDSFFGTQVGKYLSGAEGVNANEVDAKSMALWFAMDRFEQLKNYEDGVYDVLLLNRYVLSNAVYQSIRERDIGAPDLADWVFHLEHDVLHLPEPDLYLFFDVSQQQAERNVYKKGYREYVGEGRDVYESSKGIQQRARDKYIEYATRYDNIAVIDCMEDGAFLKPEVIASRVQQVLAAHGLAEARK